MADKKKVERVRQAYASGLLSLPNVIGLGAGLQERSGIRTGEISLVVLVRRKLPLAALDPAHVVPKWIDEVQTDVREVGEIKPLSLRTDRVRPAVPGVSLGHYRISAGTFGAVVHDERTGEALLLSNNHVLADSNQGNAGDPILQPGTADGGRLDRDQVATLERFAPIQFTVEPSECGWAEGVAALANAAARAIGSSHRLQAYQTNPQASNLVDAAVARPINPEDIQAEILEIGKIEGVRAADLGATVRKSGRTTGFTLGEVVVIGATLSVNYGPSRRARFEEQIITTPMSSPGDSGSLLVAGDSPDAVGLLFAGSDQATIHNPIEAVLQQLEVRLP